MLSRQISFWLCQLAEKSSFKGYRSPSQESDEAEGNLPSTGVLQQSRKHLVGFERHFTTPRPDSAWSCTFTPQQQKKKAPKEKPQRGISREQTLHVLREGSAGSKTPTALRGARDGAEETQGRR